MQRAAPQELTFPDPRHATDEGLVAVGGDFSPERLLAAYSRGIFPWPLRELPYVWFSPDPRMVLPPAELHVPRSLGKVLRRAPFRVTWDRAFAAVVRACAAAPRPGQPGTWIHPELAAGFVALHRRGHAHSVEVWAGEQLVGGLYGLAIGRAFTGESMFHRLPDASKVAFVHLVRRLAGWGFQLVDCQVYSPHLARFGAREWPRDRFLDALAAATAEPGRPGPWSADDPPAVRLPDADRPHAG